MIFVVLISGGKVKVEDEVLGDKVKLKFVSEML